MSLIKTTLNRDEKRENLVKSERERGTMRRGDACTRQSTDRDPQTRWHREHRLFQGCSLE